MAVNIKNPFVERLARRSAELRETGITEALQVVLERDVEELEEARQRREIEILRRVREIQEEIAALPMADPRPIKEIEDELWDDVVDSHR